ncbi:MAG: hypothetical protein JW839_20505 [Candidatus Lokiarchaeota archaeon]|nr:hypothetical protein [Candidatus Lokiarchaeota archaeon]
MEHDILLWIAWSFGVALFVIAILPLVRENRATYNATSDNFVKMMVVLVFLQAGGFVVKYLLLDVMGLQEPIFPKNLRIDMIVSFGMLAVLLHFSLYATGKRKHYGLPWIWYIFILTFMVQIGDTMVDAPVVSSAVVAISLVGLFLVKAIKNRFGLMLGIALYIITNVVFALLNQYVASTVTLEITCNLLAFVSGNAAIALATWNIYDRYVLYDRKKEQAIKSTWIAKIMQTQKVPVGMAATRDGNTHQGNVQIQRRVTCPVCKASRIWLLPGDLISARNNSQKGITLVPVPAGTTCDHAYSMYLSKAFDILGYEG